MSVLHVAQLHHNDPYHEQRCQLAATFRWVARLNMHEGVANHFSLAVNDDGTKFLMNPCNRHFSRIRASDLILLDANDPKTMDRPDAPDVTAWALHGAIHRRSREARCVMHVHSKYATVLATLKDPGMPPIDQNTMRFYDRLAFDDGYDGMGMGDEAERVCGRFGDKPILVMGNHGVMVSGPNVAWAFDDLYYFERAAETLVTAYMTGRELLVVSDEVARKTMQQWMTYENGPENHLREIMGILDDEGSDFRA
ncbi:MAG: hypothetical protein GC150_16415 [Rhizobiales bacterium]|nr:hypothetical protein [Hyphomicrobiales bacterium]